MIRSIRHLGVVLVATSVLASGGWVPNVHAASPEEAEATEAKPVEEAARRYDRGLKFYAEGEYRLAVIEFERTYELVPDFRVLYNIGQVRIQLSDYARARTALQRYLTDGAGQIKPDRERAVRADLEMLEGRTATLSIGSLPVGAEVFVDGEHLGTTPLAEPVLLNAGEHTIELRKNGYRNASARRTLAGSDKGELVLELEAVPIAPIVMAPAAPSGRDSSSQPVPRSSVPMWVGWSVTGALVAGSVVTSILGNRAADDLDAAKRRKDVDSATLQSQSNKAQMLLITGDALAAAAVVAGSVSLYFTLRGPAPRQQTRDAATLQLGFDASRVHLQGSF